MERGRFLVLDYQAEWDAALAELAGLVLGGSIAAPETITRGFAPGDAFCDMMGGGNVGKAIVMVDSAYFDDGPRQPTRYARLLSQEGDGEGT